MNAPDERNPLQNAVDTPTMSDSDTPELVATAKRDLAGLGDEVKHHAQAIGEEAKTQIGEMVGDVTDKAMGLASEQKEMLTGHLEGVASALDRVATELEDGGEPTARYARIIADGTSNLLATVADRDVDDLIALAQDFGRRQPVAFLGAAALLGFAASRFVLASATRRNETSPEQNAAATPASAYDDDGDSLLNGGSTTPSPYGTTTIGGSNGTI